MNEIKENKNKISDAKEDAIDIFKINKSELIMKKY